MEMMTRKQIDEVEKNVMLSQNKYDRNKDKLVRINKVLVNAKAGIEHIYEKLQDIKIEGLDPKAFIIDKK